MQLQRMLRSLFIIGLVLSSLSAEAGMSIDVLSLTLPARALPDLNLPDMGRSAGMRHMPFYLRVNYWDVDNVNWAFEIFSNNQPGFPNVTTPDGLWRGLRGNSVVAESIPLYWQIYSEDQNVPESYGTPESVSSTVGGLGFYPNTLHYWGVVYDRSDIDKQAFWDRNISERLMIMENENLGFPQEPSILANERVLADFPQVGRRLVTSPYYLYFAVDIRSLTMAQTFQGTLTLRLINFGMDYSKGCFATPNPVKPVLGQKVYFNFYTNSTSSKIKIKILDPTGFPVRTLENNRYWDCRNDSGHLVEGGLYIYQIEVEGHVISGTVVVIK
jgi:hypothetical protein